MIGEISSDITEDSDMEMGIIYNNKTWISRNVDAITSCMLANLCHQTISSL